MKNTSKYFFIVAVTSIIACQSAEKNNNPEGDNAFQISAPDTALTKKNISAKLDTGDVSLFKEGAMSSLAGIEASEKIIQMGSREEIIKLAKKVIEDHQKQIDELARVAKKKGYTTPATLSSKRAADIIKMSSLKSDARDETYLKILLAAQKKALELYTVSGSSPDPDINVLAQRSIPILNEHFAETQKLEQKLLEPKGGQGDDLLRISDQTKPGQIGEK